MPSPEWQESPMTKSERGNRLLELYRSSEAAIRAAQPAHGGNRIGTNLIR